jgi:pyruvate,orthophosphate dikinase
MNDRAKFYRRMHDIPESWGTAVNIQSMVFGNMGETSATGVAFTRNPSNGENRLYGEFLINAQGEDVVAGIRTPQSLTKAAREEMGDRPSMEEAMPEVFAQFKTWSETLEPTTATCRTSSSPSSAAALHAADPQREAHGQGGAEDRGRHGAEGVISQDEAMMRVEPASLDQLLHPTIDPTADRNVIAAGLPASPGAATGKIVFDSDEAERLGAAGEAVILVREETSPEDIHGMHAARGIVTARGGMTSHAAVVARGMGRPCVSGAGEIHHRRQGRPVPPVGKSSRPASHHHRRLDRRDPGRARRKMIEPELTGDFAILMDLGRRRPPLKVRANAETPLDAKTARQFGAEGIGLCRTEHMFFDDTRIAAVREMILADDEAGRRTALAKIAAVPEGRLRRAVHDHGRPAGHHPPA